MFSSQKKKWSLCYVTEALTNTKVVIILQYLSVSNQHDAHIKVTQCSMSIKLQ